MSRNGKTANRDEKELQRCADMVSVNTLGSPVRGRKGAWDTRKQRLFVKAIEAIERGCEKNERWAVQHALALTIGKVGDFVESEVGTPDGGFEVIVQETQTQTRKVTQRVTANRPAAETVPLPASD